MAHQHGPQCRHGHGHGHQHGHGHGPMNPLAQAPQQSPQQYFRILFKKWSDNRVFFWQEVLHGVVLDKIYERFGLDFMRSLSCQMPQMIVHSIESMASFQWIPFKLRPIVSGLFFPLIFLLFFNYNVVVGVGSPPDDLLWLLSVSTMLLYLLVAIRGCSTLNSEELRVKSKEVYAARPYLQNPQMSCSGCGIVRLFRAAHCQFCKTCVAKHSRHSLIWGSCIGAANQFLALLFFAALTLAIGKAVGAFFVKGSYGAITKVMFYTANVVLCWMSANQFLQLFIFNLVYGVTQQELKTWPMQQYLQKIPQREFFNNVDQGFCLNLQSSLMACFGLKGYESEQGWGHSNSGFPLVDPNRSYRINWARAFVYLIPQLPFHKNRNQILEMMQREEPKMIEMFKLQARFKEEVLAESAGQQLNEFQLQQKIAQKMQAHMMRNMPQMMPSPQQQRTIQLQMLTHMRREFTNEPELGGQVEELIKKLETNSVSAIEANMAMRQIQQQLMKKRMEKVMKQAQEQKLVEKNKSEEEEAPMRSVADQDL